MKGSFPHRTGVILYLLFFLGAALYVFQDVFQPGRVMFSPDSAPFFGHGFQRYQWLSFVGNWDMRVIGAAGGIRSFYPQVLLGVLLPPMVFHVASYVVDTLLLGLAAMFLLRGHGLRGLPLAAGGLAMAFSGYAFTLISAGHRGMFDMMPFAVCLFPLIDRAVRERRLIWFALGGLCVAYGLAAQPDVMAMFLILGAAYAGWGVYREIRSGSSGSWGALLVRLSVGGVVVVVVVLLAGSSLFSAITQTILPQRIRQVGEGSSKADQWIFATNWSMPPEEILEFVAPGVFGVETGDPEAPYWGRLGRSVGWPADKGLQNLKQHTVYLGVVQLALAAYAVAAALANRKSRAAGFSADKAGTRSQGGGGTPSAAVGQRWTGAGDTVFWSVVFILTVLLALGRYFPAPFRLFHSLPYLSFVRCPVKFIHLAELALAVLFAHGLYRLQRRMEPASGDSPVKLERVLAAVCLALGFILVVAGGLAPKAKGLADYWQRTGHGAYAPLISIQMRDAMWRGSALFVACSVVFLVAGLPSPAPWKRYALPGALLVLAIGDVACVDRLYVNTRDLSAYYAANPVADRVAAGGSYGRISAPMLSRRKFDPLWVNFHIHRVFLLEPPMDLTLPEDTLALFQTLSSSPLRLWQVTSTEFIAAPRSGVRQFLESPDFEGLMGFDVEDYRIIQANSGLSGKYVLMRYRSALPRAAVFYSWAQSSREDALKKLADPAWDPAGTVLVSGEVGDRAGSQPPTIARITRCDRNRVDIEADAPEAGILLLNDRYDPEWQARVDGHSAEILPCNSIMRGIRLPAGKHRVTFQYRPGLPSFALSALTACGLAVWGVLEGMARRRRPETVTAAFDGKTTKARGCILGQVQAGR